MTLRKLDIKVETVNREPLTMHSDREDDTASVSTATRVMKAIYSVRVLFFPSLVPSSHSEDQLPPALWELLSLSPASVYLGLTIHSHTDKLTSTHMHTHNHPHIHMLS